MKGLIYHHSDADICYTFEKYSITFKYVKYENARWCKIRVLLQLSQRLNYKLESTTYHTKPKIYFCRENQKLGYQCVTMKLWVSYRNIQVAMYYFKRFV